MRDSGFRRNDGVSGSCKNLMEKLFGAESAEKKYNRKTKKKKICISLEF